MVNNPSNYKEVDLIRALFTISKKRISRAELVDELSLGEGTVRSVLEELKEDGLIGSSQQGHILSDKGKDKVRKLERLRPRKVDVKIDKIHGDTYNVGLVVKGFKKKDINFTLRDHAVREGAYGALIFYFDKILELPGVEKHEFEYLVEEFSLDKKDTLVVVSAKDKKTAENAAISLGLKMSQ